MSTKSRDQRRTGTPSIQPKSKENSEAPPSETSGALSMSAPVEQEIERALGEVLLPIEAMKATRTVLKVIAHEQSIYRGPIPRPSDFKDYDLVLPVRRIASWRWRSGSRPIGLPGRARL